MPMFEIDAVCSDPRCDQEITVWAADLEEVDLVVCECGGCLVTVRVSEHRPPQPPVRAALVLVPAPDDDGDAPHSAEPPALAA